MTISYDTIELLSKSQVPEKPAKPKKPKAVKSTNGKTKGPGAKPSQPKPAKPVNSVKPPTQAKAPAPATPSLPGYDKPAGAAQSTPAPAAPNLPGYEPNPGLKKSYEDVEKMGLLGVGGMLAGGLGRAKAGVKALKPKAKTALGPAASGKLSTGMNTASGKLSTGMNTAKTKLTNTYKPGGQWNTGKIKRHSALAGGGLAAGMMIKSDTKKKPRTDAEKRLRDIQVGTASNVFGAGMGAIATTQAVRQGQRNFKEYEKQTRKGRGRGVGGARENPKPEYRPQSKVGRAIHRHLPKGLKNNKYAVPALILGGATAGATGQAINGLMDANSARVFMNEERQLKRKLQGEEGVVKSVEITTGNGHGTNLSSWYGSNPDASEGGFTSVGKAIRHGSEVRDTASEKQRNKRNTAAVVSAVGGTAAAGYQGKRMRDDYKKFQQRSATTFGGLRDRQGNPTKMKLRDVAGFGSAKGKIKANAEGKKTLSQLYGSRKQWQEHQDLDSLKRDAKDKKTGKPLKDKKGAPIRDWKGISEYHIESQKGRRKTYFEDEIRPKRRKRISDSHKKGLKTARYKMSGRAGLAAGGAGLAYAGYKAKTD